MTKLKKNSDKTKKTLKFWQNSISDTTLSLLVKATWHLDNPWNLLCAAFCNSCDVF